MLCFIPVAPQPTDRIARLKGPVAGVVFGNYGPRWILLAGSFLHVFGIMMTSLGTEYYQLLLSGLVLRYRPVGNLSTLSAPTPNLLPTEFPISNANP